MIVRHQSIHQIISKPVASRKVKFNQPRASVNWTIVTWIWCFNPRQWLTFPALPREKIVHFKVVKNILINIILVLLSRISFYSNSVIKAFYTMTKMRNCFVTNNQFTLNTVYWRLFQGKRALNITLICSDSNYTTTTR